ncbi:MAG: CHAT domain-containing protein [Leptolyngbya sp. SIOISBB]|nr:CHAT domain-containing protein [Leptolyngbya sp. SIOISBB]
MTKSLRQRLTHPQVSSQKSISEIYKQTETVQDNDITQAAEVEQAKLNSGNNQTVEGEKFLANLDKKFSREAALLYVESIDKKYFIHVHNDEMPPLETIATLPPLTSLHAQMTMAHSPSEILGCLKGLSEHSQIRRVRGWLMELQKKLNGLSCELSLECLVINDRTKFEIPWEMLDFDRKGETTIGASFATVRWQDIPDPEDFEWRGKQKNLQLATHSLRCDGPILAYANIKELQSAKNELDILRQFLTKSFSDLRAFLDHVDQDSSKVSLLFIASHGFFGENTNELSFGESSSEKQKVSYMELHRWKFNSLKACPSLVFMNSCHSGRLKYDEKNIFDPESRMGFANFFLKRGAKGVIGSMGKIRDDYAFEFAKRFFEEYRNNANLTVAEILRNLRAKAAFELNSSTTQLRKEESILFYLYTFMYVYYGHPFVTLKILENHS